MRPYLLASVVAAAVCLAAPSPAAAQATGTSSSTKKPSTKPPKPKKPPAPKLPVEYRVFGVFEPEFMAASSSFNAVTGSSITYGYGGGAGVFNVWQKLFIRGGVTFASASGQRGFVEGGVFVPNGIATSLNLRTIELGAGWREPLKKHPKTAIYFGGGLVLLNYSDTSNFAAAGENVNQSFTGFGGELGVDMTLSKLWVFSLEGQYRTIPSNPATNSIQFAYNETDLGGFAVRAMFAVRFGKSAPAAPQTPKKK